MLEEYKEPSNLEVAQNRMRNRFERGIGWREDQPFVYEVGREERWYAHDGRVVGSGADREMEVKSDNVVGQYSDLTLVKRFRSCDCWIQ